MKKALLLSTALALGTTAFAQTVTVDSNNASPDGVTTFNSLMAAIHSFQASGVGGVGVNHGNAAADVINIAAGSVFDESVRINVRADSADQAVLDEALTINGPGAADGTYDAPSATANAVIKLQDDTGSDSTYGFNDGFVIIADVDVTLNNLTFVPSATNTPADDLVYIDRETSGAGNMTVTFNGCVMTSADGSGDPVVNSKAEALVDNTANIGGTNNNGAFLITYPDTNESLNTVLNDCVLSHNAGAVDGEGIIYQNDNNYTVGADGYTITVNSSVISYVSDVLVDVSYGDNTDADPEKTYVEFGGDSASAGPVDAKGGPTVIAYNTGKVLWDPARWVALRGIRYDNTIIAENDGNPVLDASANTVLGISNSLVQTSAGADLIWLQGDGLHTKVQDATNSTFVGGTFIVNAAQAGGGSMTFTDCIISNPAGNLLSGSGDFTVNFDYCGIDTTDNSGSFASVTVSNATLADPQFVSTNPASADFLDVANTAYAGQSSTSGNLSGGADYAPTSAVNAWSRYAY